MAQGEKEVSSDVLYEFKKKIKELKGYKGSGTELISVYIPAGSPIHETTAKLRAEMSQASNIKSKSTRNNVLGALERIINYLKHFKQTPENGLCIFAGNISQDPSKVNIKLFEIQPPFRLSVGAYRCDSKFFLEPLERMLGHTDAYGIVAMDGREATLAIVRGTQIDIVKKLNSTAHAKVRKGGQSARRYERLIQESTERYYKRIGEAMDEHFLNRVKGVIVGGPGPAKDDFMKLKPFNYQIKVLGVVDTGYTDEYGVREVMAKGEHLIKGQEAVKEKKIVETFIKTVVKDGLATYGINEVINALESKQASKILVSEKLPFRRVVYQCSSCGYEKIAYTKEKPDDRIKCEKCGGQMRIVQEEPLIDFIVEKAREKGIEVEVISSDTVEGAQFLNAFGGLGAFLRYKL